MNPPSALYGASRERKPFTYTPGGLDLSEIKSERMAKRLMRNAMNQGVPETPAQLLKSPPASGIPVAVPNFNCLPVQVFPTFQLPANPKSLLRTRSIPDGSRETVNKVPTTSQLSNNANQSNVQNFNYLHNNANKEPNLSNIYNVTLNNPYRLPKSTYGDVAKPESFASERNSNANTHLFLTPVTGPNTTLYKENANDFNFVQKKNIDMMMENQTVGNSVPNINSYIKNTEPLSNENIDFKRNSCLSTPHDFYEISKPTIDKEEEYYLNYSPNVNQNYAVKYPTPIPDSESIANIGQRSYDLENKVNFTANMEIEKNEQKTEEFINNQFLDKSHNENNDTLSNLSIEDPVKLKENYQEETVITQSNTKKESISDDQNGNTETAVVVKLPGKKSAAKTETKVEVVQNILPDGSVQEVKTTTTRTTVDGKTEIATKTETLTIPKEESDEEVYEEEEEEEVEEHESEEIQKHSESKESNNKVNGESIETQQIKQNGEIIIQEEKTETSTTKKVIVQAEVQNSGDEAEETEEVEESQEDVDVEEVIVIKKTNVSESADEKEEENEEEESKELKESIEKTNDTADDEEVVSEYEEETNVDNDTKEEEICEKIEKDQLKQNTEPSQNDTEEEKEPAVEEEIETEVEEFEEAEDNIRYIDEEKAASDNHEETTDDANAKQATEEKEKEDIKLQTSEEKIIPIQTEVASNKDEQKAETGDYVRHTVNNDTFREPSIPFEKVEDVEIKPIAPVKEIITKSHKEIITTTTDKPSGALSTQTEYNVIENIVTVNRTTKTLDHAYEQAGEYTIPVVKTSLIPDNTSALPPSQPISRPYQPAYSTEPSTERRHSLLLERLSVERQLPTPSIYQTDSTYNSHVYEERRSSIEPQSEISIENNVKPSTINKNQQWYSRKESFDNITQAPGQQWTPSQPQYQAPQQQYQAPQPQYQAPQPQYQAPQPQYQASQPQYQSPQPQYQTSQPQYQSPQPQYQSPQPQYQSPQQQYHSSQSQYQPIQSQYQPPQKHTPQSTYSETLSKDSYKPLSNNTSYVSNNYNTYTPKPSWVSSTVDPKPTSFSQPSQHSYLNNESTTYQTSTQNQTSYVPPPWEQESTYNVDSFNQNSYQQTPAPATPVIKPTSSWKPPTNKFTKTKPTSYIPPAPNQSFVKPVNAETDPPKLAGRKTYYSEYERRYITVPESTYIPTETKFQAQPDPSPKYYYDQPETVESVEPQWRKELREFTEKTQTSSQTIESSVRPPWEDDPKYATTQLPITPTWNQTLRPRSYREQSIESDYTTTAKEWSKTNTLGGRGRPQSSYLKNNLERISERTRGVSVDRYNPNNYTSPVPAEHPPVQSQTLDPLIHPKPHYNPNVPSYHSRASAEPREQPVYNNQQRVWVGESRAPPVQSRSFKYLQWITGTED